MEGITRPLLELGSFEEIKDSLKDETGMIQISGLVSSQRTHMMYALGDGFEYKIIACSGELKAKEIYEEYKYLEEDVYYYPPKDLLFYKADLRSKDILKERSELIDALLRGEPLTVITDFSSFMDPVIDLETIKENIRVIKSDDTVSLNEWSVFLTDNGYERCAQVDSLGQFAIRGGILDIYPLTMDNPVRIELWGDEVDSIRIFDVLSQRSLEAIDEVRIFPATDYPGLKKRQTFLDYFPVENTLLYLDDPLRIIEKGKAIEEEFVEAQARRVEEGFQVTDSEISLLTTEQVQKKMNKYYSVGFYAIDVKKRGFKIKKNYFLEGRSVSPYNSSFDALTRDLKRLKREGYRVILISGSRTRARRLAEDLRDYNLSSFYSEDANAVLDPGEILTTYGYIATGYEYPLIKFEVISESDIFGRIKKKKKKKTYEGRRIQDFQELKIGDYVVHENHGLGIYQGIEQIQIDKVVKDFIKISYAKGGNLYIPATGLDLIQKYANADAKKPRLNQLGSKEWGNTKSRVKKAVGLIAKDLVELYAKRQEAKGYKYGEDTLWQKEFEELFPFEETRDQLAAIEDVKQDMESDKVMDRLICGDVGYGKTEIAIRAAFKAVQENKQVVYLVPTTILAQQHYNTFTQRMKEYPVRVDLMNRFRTAKEQKKTIEDTKKGLVDIVIGTHRVLSEDLKFKDLGLLVIDEEQRFGVKHKEKIKALKENVDVLTLTATPIPRTLHMSLIGVRDMSVLEEAPGERMPIQTYVMEYNTEMVREAIERECARGGQVYYVYNKVEDIKEITAKISKLVPELNVAYAHGQMRENRLESIMMDFINGEIDVLVSTTIIETGLDIPNVNTMIIHDADKFGLSQLYQLRGRVGRSNRMAYAFLLYQRNKLLKQEAEKRLSAIREFTDLGSGFKIAMRDLEIRGAGNLLGESQSGHMEAVGYDMYTKMLNEAIRHLKGETKTEEFATSLDINVDAFIPSVYIQNEGWKIDVYKRIAAMESEEDKDAMIEELIDRFGDVPKKVEMLIDVAMLKAKAHNAYLTAVEEKPDGYYFTMLKEAPVNTVLLPDMLKEYRNTLTFRADPSPVFFYKKTKEKPMEIVEKVINSIKGLIEN